MSSLPIRRVVLYKHGVGYFEREAAVHGDAALALSFKQREVSDVLKSLTVLDLDGGTVAAVSYDSTTPVEQLLAEIALSIPDKGSLVGLLPQLKGARAAVTPAGGSRVEGAILGVDKADTRTEHGLQEQVRVSLLTDAGEVRTFDLFGLDLTLLDDGVRRDLDFYLKTQLAAKKKDARTFTLFARGEGSRTVRVSYVLEAPVWKATYRILLNEQSPAATTTEPQPLIQGWAVVDNTSDEDWVDVSLTLVAGLPVSFVHDLYTPRYIRRPVVAVRETTGVLPPTAEAGMDVLDDDDDDDAGGMAMSMPAPPPLAARSDVRRAVYNEVDEASRFKWLASAKSSVETQTRERQVGDLFEYGIENPVTVRRNQSALVPIVLKAFAGRSVLLYQKAARAENPMRCVEFENTTGLTLEGGPVTVLDGGSYVGEAMLDTLKPTDKRLVGYAVELAVRVLDNVRSFKQDVHRVVVSKGTLVSYFGQAEQMTYTFTSKADKEQVVYLDHPRPGGDYTLFDTPKPHEITEKHWRFRFPLPPHATTAFVVKTQRPDSQRFVLGEIKDVQFTAWIEAKYVDKKLEKALRESFTVRRQVVDLDEKLKRLAAERDQIHAEQKRVRENMKAVGDRAAEKELRTRFVTTLGKQEDRLEAIAAEEATLLTERAAARDRLAETLNNLEYKADLAG